MINTSFLRKSQLWFNLQIFRSDNVIKLYVRLMHLSKTFRLQKFQNVTIAEIRQKKRVDINECFNEGIIHWRYNTQEKMAHLLISFWYTGSGSLSQ